MTRKRLLLLLLVGFIATAIVVVWLTDRDKRLTFRIAKRCCDQRTYVRVLLQSFNTGSDRIRRRVLTTIDPSETNLLVELARDQDPALRSAAVRVLIQTRPAGIAKVVELLKEDDMGLVDQTSTILIEARADVVPFLIAGAGHDDQSVRWWCIRTLGRIGAADEKTLDLLDRVASDKQGNSDQKLAAIRALGEIGPPSVTRIPTLVRLLENRDPEVRAASARALDMIGASAQEALPALTVALSDEDAIVRQNAWHAILRIQDPSLR